MVAAMLFGRSLGHGVCLCRGGRHRERHQRECDERQQPKDTRNHDGTIVARGDRGKCLCQWQAFRLRFSNQ
jgi:hypothetical protein